MPSFIAASAVALQAAAHVHQAHGVYGRPFGARWNSLRVFLGQRSERNRQAKENHDGR
jgi:hypothetical protein